MEIQTENNGKKRDRKSYRKSIIESFIQALLIAYPIALWPASYKLTDIRGGDHPDQPRSEREQLYQEALPSVVTEAIIRGLLTQIIVFAIILIIRFKVSHNMNLFYVLRNNFKKEKQ